MQHLAVVVLCVAALTGCEKDNRPKPAAAETAAGSAREALVAEAPLQAGISAPAPTRSTRTLTRSEFDEIGARILTILKAMAAVAEKSGTDCGEAAESIDKILADHKDFIAMMKQYKDDPETARLAEEWWQRQQDELVATTSKMSEMISRCTAHPGFKAVFAKLEDG